MVLFYRLESLDALKKQTLSGSRFTIQEGGRGEDRKSGCSRPNHCAPRANEKKRKPPPLKEERRKKRLDMPKQNPAYSRSMKHPTLQKVTLMAMALVASFALSAQAGRPTLTSATQKHGTKKGAGHFPFSAKQAGNGQQSPMEFIYSIDDGSAEDGIGLTLGGDIISLNEFAVVPGAETIDTVSIAWGTPAFPDPTLNGLPYTVAIWSDPNGDGSPTDAVLLNTASGVVSMQGTDTFLVTDIPDTTITTANFFVGFLITHSGGQFPAAFDETAPTFSNRSYVAGGASGNINDLNMNDLPVAPIESFGLIGNWLVRAHSSGTPSPTPTPTPTSTPAGALWYNGDFNGVNGLANERDTSLGSGQFAQVFDDFNVNDEAGWDVDEVYSHNLENTNVTGATWEIRQGMSEGNGGSLVASGMTATPVVTQFSPGGFGFLEFEIKVIGLNVHLGPGTYHLNVTPTGDLTGRSFDSTTDGLNCIGTPCGNNQNAFFNSNFFGAVYTDTANFGQPYDFSMGVNGDVTGSGGNIVLEARVRRQGSFRAVTLHWSPADGGDINVLRNGVVVQTTADDGQTRDKLNHRTGTFTYQVCETDSGDCSNTVVIDVTAP
jgi:hypothetical protein